MAFDLALVWAGIIVFAVLTYVVLDGFDLGIGILFPFAESHQNRDVMMNSVAPVWDGNETWLIMGGGGLFAVFPLAYAVLMPALYMPIILMVLALIFRGVAFEYRWRTLRWRGVWDVSFTGGSLFSAMMQGIALGAILQGIEVADRAYAGGWWDWLTPFSVLTGVAATTGYTLLGAAWLVMKTSDDLREQMRTYCKYLSLITVALIGLVSAFIPFQNPAYFERWLQFPSSLLSVLMPSLVLTSLWVLLRGLKSGNDYTPFFATLAIFFFSFIGIIISVYPYMVPTSLTIWQTVAPHSSLTFMLIGTSVLIPMIIIYTGYAYWVFRGKINPEEGYH